MPLEDDLVSAGATPEVARAMAAAGVPFSAKAGQTLFRPGDVCAGYLAPYAGAIRVSLITENGRQATLYRVLPGDLCVQTFQCLVTGATYAAEGVAEGDLEGLMLTRPAFERLMASDRSFCSYLLARLAARMGSLMEALEAIAFTPLPQRLAQALLRSGGASVPATHADLANEIGAAREAVSRVLDLWKREGLLALGRGRVEILRRDALSQRAQSLV
jgi:CRP/FNR family transcriptional regulator